MNHNVISEVSRVREIMGLLNEQDEKRLTLPFEKTFKAGYWKLSPEVKSQIDTLMGQVKSFVEKHTGNVIRLTVNSGESQITNFDREQNPAVSVEQGYLSNKRYETILNYLKKSYPNLLKNLTVEKKVILGDTPYSKTEFAQNCGNQGQNRDSQTCKSFFKKYEPEQFINFTVEVLGKEPPPQTTPKVDSPICNVNLGGKGKQGNASNDFVSVNKKVSTGNVAGTFTVNFNPYSVPDRAQLYKVSGEKRELIVDTGYFGASNQKAYFGGLTYHYNENPESIAFKDTELTKLNIKTFENLIDVYLEWGKGKKSRKSYDRAVRDGGERGGMRYLKEKFEGSWNKSYPFDYSPYKLWRRGVRTFLFPDVSEDKTLEFTIGEDTSEIQSVIFGPLETTVMSIKVICQ